MKWISLLLSFYIFSLCYYPCKDNGDHKEYAVHSVNAGNSCNDHPEDNCAHKCSPFCFCNCCQVNTVVSLTFQFHEISRIPVEFSTEYIEHSIPEVHPQIWQPPKI